MAHVIRWRARLMKWAYICVRDPDDSNVDYAQATTRLILKRYGGELQDYLRSYSLWWSAKLEKERRAFKAEGEAAGLAAVRAPRKKRVKRKKAA